MTVRVEDLLGLSPNRVPPKRRSMRFSCLFFSDTREDVSDAQKYAFMGEITRFADKAGFEGIYIPERHFQEFGSIFANPAIVAAHLIPQTERIRFRTAGVTLPLHHPAEVVEWWAMNDVLSGGRVDLGFGSGWSKDAFVFQPDTFDDRRQICSERIRQVQKLWQGETLSFPGPDGIECPVTVFPRPVQKSLNVWLLITQNEEAFRHAGREGYNVFTMLYNSNLETLSRKIDIYRQARAEAGYDPNTGTITLTLHTLVLDNRQKVLDAIEKPFKTYIASALNAHVNAGAVAGADETTSEADRQKMLEFAYERYVQTSALFGTPDDARKMVDRALDAGVDEIACIPDFGVPYDIVHASLPYLKDLVEDYSEAGIASMSDKAK